MIICTILVCDRMTTFLFDLGSTFSYVFTYFVVDLCMICESVDNHVHVSSLVGDFVIVATVYHSYEVTFMGYKILVDLVILDMVEFDIILGMS